jgi:hypothetical protein
VKGHFPACVAALLAGMLAATAAAQAPSQRGIVAPNRIVPIPATASVVGRITAADSLGPVRGAEVRLRATDGRENRLITTDADGRYQIRGLTAGEWTLTASKAGFISQQFGQRRPFEAPHNLTVDTGKQVNADIQLTRAGAISGRVYDEFGDPVAGARVQVMRTRMVRGRRTTVPVGVGDLTDDTGAFRLYALAPGDYYVGASLRTAPAENTIIDSVATTPTYYPGTPALGEAARITLGAGEEQINVNFTIQPVRAVTVSGTVLSSSGAPAREGLFVNLVSSDVNSNGMPLGTGGVVRGAGGFSIANVPPGNYTVQAVQMGGGPEGMEQAAVPLTVGTEDVRGIALALSRPAMISGVIVADGSRPLPAGFSYRVSVRAVGPLSSQQMFSATLARTDTAFQLTGMFGPMIIAVEDLPEGLMLNSIDINGEDYTDRPYDFRGGQNVTARIVVTSQVTDVTGTVTKQSRPAAQTTVVIFPEDTAKWTYPSRYVQVARTDDDGRFKLRRLPPDSRYLAVAVDYLEEGDDQDPDVLEQLRAQARGFALDFGDQRVIDLGVSGR